MNRLACKHRAPVFVLLGFMLGGCSALLPPPISRFEVQTPRPFGYVMGDEIRHRVVIETRRDIKFNPASVPAQGAINRWLYLNQVKIDSNQDRGETVIDLTYQVFYAANEVKMLHIPGFNLQFTRAGTTVEQAVPAWPFTLSPLKELAVRKDGTGLQYMRPDAMPAPLSSQAPWMGFLACLGTALALGSYLSYLYGYVPFWPQQRIFKQALHRLGKLRETELEQGLAVLHHAFNRLHGQPLFKHTLADFYRCHSEYRSAAGQVDWFFDFSNRVLFGGETDAGGEGWAKLHDLCRLCREIECGKR